MATNTIEYEGGVVRTARKSYDCYGAGGRLRPHADDCANTIQPGDQYLEYLDSAPAYQSGERICMACAREFYTPMPRRALCKICERRMPPGDFADICESCDAKMDLDGPARRVSFPKPAQR